VRAYLQTRSLKSGGSVSIADYKELNELPEYFNACTAKLEAELGELVYPPPFDLANCG
jgi:hypothetical protein